MANKVLAAAGGSIHGKRIAVLGLTFKANTDDLRESPAVDVVRALIGLGAKVRAFDPQGMGQARRILPDIDYASGTYEAIDGADILVILTEWPEFATLDLDRVRRALAAPVVVDLRNLYDPAEMAAAGFTYHCIGRPAATPSS
jgi:UDPglucose 6-dehydrogenase